MWHNKGEGSWKPRPRNSWSASQGGKCQGGSVPREAPPPWPQMCCSTAGAAPLLCCPPAGAAPSPSPCLFPSVSACSSSHHSSLLLYHPFCLPITTLCSQNSCSQNSRRCLMAALYFYYQLFFSHSNETKLTSHSCTRSSFPVQSPRAIKCYLATWQAGL